MTCEKLYCNCSTKRDTIKRKAGYRKMDIPVLEILYINKKYWRFFLKFSHSTWTAWAWKSCYGQPQLLQGCLKNVTEFCESSWFFMLLFLSLFQNKGLFFRFQSLSGRHYLLKTSHYCSSSFNSNMYRKPEQTLFCSVKCKIHIKYIF